MKIKNLEIRFKWSRERHGIGLSRIRIEEIQDKDAQLIHYHAFIFVYDTREINAAAALSVSLLLCAQLTKANEQERML